MSKTYSIVQARGNFADIVAEAEAGLQVELTRRGKPVAMLISTQDYLRLTSKTGDFSNALENFSARYDLQEVALEADFVDGLRDVSAGRKVEL